MAEASGRIKHIDSDEDFEKELREAGDKLVVVEFFSEEYVLFYATYSGSDKRPLGPILSDDSSGVARLGHTAWGTTRGRAPPVQVYASELSALIVSL